MDQLQLILFLVAIVSFNLWWVIGLYLSIKTIELILIGVGLLILAGYYLAGAGENNGELTQRVRLLRYTGIFLVVVMAWVGLTMEQKNKQIK